MTTKSRRIISLLSAAVLLLLTLLVLLLVLPRLRNQPIRIKTQLSPDEVADVVELSSGTLYFKDELSLYKEMTTEERKAYTPKPSHYFPEYSKSFLVEAADVRYVLNIDPEQWAIPERFAFGYEIFPYFIRLIQTEAPETDYCDDVLYTVSYRDDEQAFIWIRLGLPEKRWMRDTEEGPSSPSLTHLKTAYGELNSRIGKIPASVLHHETRSSARPFDTYDAYFVVGNASYFVKSNGLTQQEFIELLISICQAPRPVTQSLIDYLWEQTEAETAG